MTEGTPSRPLRVLVIDDEEQIRRALRSLLQARRYEPVLAASGEEGLELAADLPPDAVILDLMLPGIDGQEVCRRLREWYAGPILVLSVVEDDGAKIRALDIGADDYLTKPFSTGELLARMRALLRRASGTDLSPTKITRGDLEIDLPRRQVLRQGELVRLTRIEFDILALLAVNAGRVVTSRMLLETVWGPEYVRDMQTLRVHVSNLRHKIETPGDVPRYVITEPGVGFRFADEA